MKKILYTVIFLLSTHPIFLVSFPEMIQLPAGTYIMGNDELRQLHKIDADGVPLDTHKEHKVKVDSFQISKYEITFKEYFDFLNDTDYKTYAELEWLSRNEEKLGKNGFREFFSASLYPNYPVTRISYEDALMYCFWLKKKTGKTYRLPTEAEWEYAATGGKMILFPWGNNYEQLNTAHSIEYYFDATFKNAIFPVDKFTKDKSLFNVYGMYGNAMEWCLDAWDPEYYDSSDYENPLQIIRKYFNEICVRGAAGYSMKSGVANLKRRLGLSPLYESDIMGFRVVQESTPSIFNKNTEQESVYYYANGRVNDSNVNVRQAPSLNSMKMFQFQKGDRVRIYLRSNRKMSIGNTSEYWYCIRRLGTEKDAESSTGWIFGTYVDIEDIDFKEKIIFKE